VTNQGIVNKKFVSVVFNQRDALPTGDLREYTYLTDLEFEKDDFAVVENSGKYAVVQVTAVRGLTKMQRDKACKWIVAKVDVEAHELRLKKAAAAQEIRNKLQELREQQEELMIYQALAQGNPDIQKLLVELAQNDDSITLLENGTIAPSTD